MFKNSILERVGAVMLLRQSDYACLLQLRDNKPNLRNPGIWAPPGGHAEPLELMIDCASREFEEETSYKCRHLNLIAEFIDHVSGWPPYYLSIYWAVYDNLQPISCNEGQAMEFIVRDNAASIGVPQYLIDIWDLSLQDASNKKGWD
jgi:ADP-ribose pyrophosphatase YjhB (NUDIX family)